MRVCGIDPGITGALCVYDHDASDMPANALVSAIDVPTIGEDSKRRVNAAAIWPWLDKLKPEHAFIELVGAMPSIASVGEDGVEGDRRSMGAASAFRFGDTVGSLRTVVVCCGIPFTLVVPPKWKRFHDLQKGATKEDSRQKAIDLVPAFEKLFSRKKDHARAEAFLIAKYGWHQLNDGKS